MTLQIRYLVSIPGTSEPTLVHRERATAYRDCREIQERGFEPKLETVTVGPPFNPWG